MDKMLKFFEELGVAAGIGAFLLVTSWGLLVADLSDFKPANIAALSTAQLVACFAGTLGLLLMLYRLKDVSKTEARLDAIIKDDHNRWERFVSFVRDRRSLAALRDYEHLPSLLASVDAIRGYLRSELDSLPPGTRMRRDFERLQEACREFATICDRTWQNREAIPSHLVSASPIDQWHICTAVGVLRGQLAATLKGREIPNSAALIARLVGTA